MLGSRCRERRIKKGNTWPSVNRAEAAGSDQFHFHRLHHHFSCNIKGPIKVPVQVDVKGRRRPRPRPSPWRCKCRHLPLDRIIPNPPDQHRKKSVFPSPDLLFFPLMDQRGAFSQRRARPPPPQWQRTPLGLITSSSAALTLPCPPRVSFGITEMLTRLRPSLIFKTKG